MKRAIWIAALVVGLLALCGCIPSYTPPSLVPSTPTPIAPTTPTAPEPPPSLQPSEPLPPSQVVAPQEGEPPIDKTWLSPGKVMVGNFYAGARAEWPLLVHNGNDTPTTFSIYYREPDHTGEGYVEAPPEVKDWVIIADCTPVIAPKTTQEIMVAIEIPKDYGGQLPPKWEFWIGVKDTTQTGMIQTEICSRWLISMRS